MEDDLQAFKTRISNYSREDLESVTNSLDGEKYPDRLAALRADIETRKSEGRHENAVPDPDGKYHTLLRRLFAGLIDACIFMVIFFLSFQPYGPEMDLWERGAEHARNKLLLLTCLPFAYSILMHWWRGATIGKMMVGVKVVDYATEGRLTFNQAVLRDAIPLGVLILSAVNSLFPGSGIPVIATLTELIDNTWYLAEIITALFNKKRRAVHDLMAGTVCIKVS